MKLLAIACTLGTILWGTSFPKLPIPVRQKENRKTERTAGQQNNDALQTKNITTAKKGNFMGLMGVTVSI